jgi:undecaprenyl-diphosphatase
VPELLESALLGLIQGLTEFLPVSSSGHLAVFQALLGWDDHGGNLTFNVAVHVGSLAAVVVFVWRDLLDVLATKRRLILVIGVASVPLGVVGVKWGSTIAQLSSILGFVGVCFMATAAALWLVRRDRQGTLKPESLSLSRAFCIGIAQAVAVLPGVSRSGSTIAAALLFGVERDKAVRLSFLMAIPAIGGAGLFEAKKAIEAAAPLPWANILVGVAASFVASLWAIRVLVGVVEKERLGAFAIYCALLGAICIVVGLAG